MNAEPSPGEESRPARIVIADDHPLFREALRGMLEGQPDLEVVAETEDGQEALQTCRRLHPDLVLMDVRMPKVDGLSATRMIKREFPRTIVLILTAGEDPDYLSKAVKVGAAGYVLKYATRQQIIGAIRGVLNGESPLNQEVAMRLLMQLLLDEAPKEENEESPDPASPAAERPFEERPHPALLELLTPREVEVLRLIARGQTNEQIAQSLLVSVSTVKKHIRHVVDKLGVSDRTQAAVRAV
jgi:DNA-binding NarL/FixJ family response regulator